MSFETPITEVITNHQSISTPDDLTYHPVGVIIFDDPSWFQVCGNRSQMLPLEQKTQCLDTTAKEMRTRQEIPPSSMMVDIPITGSHPQTPKPIRHEVEIPSPFHKRITSDDSRPEPLTIKRYMVPIPVTDSSHRVPKPIRRETEIPSPSVCNRVTCDVSTPNPFNSRQYMTDIPISDSYHCVPKRVRSEAEIPTPSLPVCKRIKSDDSKQESTPIPITRSCHCISKPVQPAVKIPTPRPALQVCNRVKNDDSRPEPINIKRYMVPIPMTDSHHHVSEPIRREVRIPTPTPRPKPTSRPKPTLPVCTSIKSDDRRSEPFSSQRFPIDNDHLFLKF